MHRVGRNRDDGGPFMELLSQVQFETRHCVLELLSRYQLCLGEFGGPEFTRPWLAGYWRCRWGQHLEKYSATYLPSWFANPPGRCPKISQVWYRPTARQTGFGSGYMACRVLVQVDSWFLEQQRSLEATSHASIEECYYRVFFIFY